LVFSASLGSSAGRDDLRGLLLRADDNEEDKLLRVGIVRLRRLGHFSKDYLKFNSRYSFKQIVEQEHED